MPRQDATRPGLTATLSTDLIQPDLKAYCRNFILTEIQKYQSPSLFYDWYTTLTLDEKSAFLRKSFNVWLADFTTRLDNGTFANQLVAIKERDAIYGFKPNMTDEAFNAEVRTVFMPLYLDNFAPNIINIIKKEIWRQTELHETIKEMSELNAQEGTKFSNKLTFIIGKITDLKEAANEAGVTFDDSEISYFLSSAIQTTSFITTPEHLDKINRALAQKNNRLQSHQVTITLDKKPEVQEAPPPPAPISQQQPPPIEDAPVPPRAPRPIQDRFEPEPPPPPILSPLSGRNVQREPEEEDPEIREAIRQSQLPHDPDPELTAALAASALEAQLAGSRPPAVPPQRFTSDPQLDPALPIHVVPQPAPRNADVPEPNHSPAFKKELESIKTRLSSYIDDPKKKSPSPGTFYGRSDQILKLNIARNLQTTLDNVFSNNATPNFLFSNIRGYIKQNRRATGNPVFHKSGVLAKILEDTHTLLFNQLTPQVQLEVYIQAAKEERAETKTGFLGIKSNQKRKLEIAERLLSYLNSNDNIEKKEGAIRSAIKMNKEATGPEWLHGSGRLDKILKRMLEELKPNPSPTKLRSE